MSTLSVALFLILVVACAAIALLVGFLIGRYAGGGSQGAAVQEARQKHDEYRSDVRTHFQETSEILSRMAEDYRAMYIHMSEGAEQLADIGTEKVITAPPPPEKLANDPVPAQTAAPAKATAKAPAEAAPQNTHRAAGKAGQKETAASKAPESRAKTAGSQPQDKPPEPNQSRANDPKAGENKPAVQGVRAAANQTQATTGQKNQGRAAAPAPGKPQGNNKANHAENSTRKGGKNKGKGNSNAPQAKHVPMGSANKGSSRKSQPAR